MSPNRQKLEEAISNICSNEVAINFNMLGALVEDGIAGNVYGSLIVTEQDSRSRNRNLEIL